MLPSPVSAAARCLAVVILLATAAAAYAHAPAARRLLAGPPAPAPAADTGAATAAAPDPARHSSYGPGVPRSFYFSRAVYTGPGMFGNWKNWRTDYPKADQQFLTVLRRLAKLDAFEREHPVRLDDPELRRFPFLYAVEVGYMRLTDEEARGLREYLLAGGFLVADDFWGTREWRAFEAQMRRVFPEHPIVDIPLDHPLFSAYYEIDELVQVPNVGQGVAGGRTSEQDGYEPHVRGIFDDQGRLMAVINWNTDLGDAWEWAEHPRYPLRYSTYAYQMGVNLIVYAMSH